jgi:hypothetical protein
MDYIKTQRKTEELITEAYRIAGIINDEIAKLYPNDVLFDYRSADYPPKLNQDGVIFSKISPNISYDSEKEALKVTYVSHAWRIPSEFFAMTKHAIRQSIKEACDKNTHGWKTGLEYNL